MDESSKNESVKEQWNGEQEQKELFSLIFNYPTNLKLRFLKILHFSNLCNISLKIIKGLFNCYRILFQVYSINEDKKITLKKQTLSLNQAQKKRSCNLVVFTSLFLWQLFYSEAHWRSQVYGKEWWVAQSSKIRSLAKMYGAGYIPKILLYITRKTKQKQKQKTSHTCKFFFNTLQIMMHMYKWEFHCFFLFRIFSHSHITKRLEL